MRQILQYHSTASRLAGALAHVQLAVLSFLSCRTACYLALVRVLLPNCSLCVGNHCGQLVRLTVALGLILLPLAIRPVHSQHLATTTADAAGMMYSIYVTSVIRYDSFVALDSKNARTFPVAGSSIKRIGSNIRGNITYSFTWNIPNCR